MKHMKLLVNIIAGLLKFNHSIRALLSVTDTTVGCLLCASSGSAIFLARRTLMTGAYVSRRNGIPTRLATPHRAAMTIKTYLTPTDCAMKPPAMGPTTGPTRGPRE